MKEILKKVCRRKTFSSVQPIYLNGKWRLAAPGLETAFYYNRLKQTDHKDNSKNQADNKADPLKFVINTPHNGGLEVGSFKAYKSATNGKTKHSILHVNWPQRIKNHCIYLTADRLHETEAYDLWLRTSAGQLRTFEDFLCFGEKVFGDCVEDVDDITSINQHGGSYSDATLRTFGEEKVNL